MARIEPAGAEASTSGAGTRTGEADRPGLAIALYVLAIGTFVSMDAIAKQLTREGLAPEQVIGLRYFLALSLLAPAVAWRRRARPLAVARPGLQALRGLFVIAAATLFVYSVRALPLATTTAIAFVSPLFVTVLSILFLKEQVGVRRWAAIVVGFLGVLAILRPGGDAFSFAMLLPIASSVCWACSLVITRAMRSGERPFSTLVWTTAVGCLAIAPLALAVWRPPDAGQMGLIAVLAGLHVAAQLLTIRAFSLAAATALAPFTYVSLVWATAIGYLAFSALPDGRTFLGAAILAVAGLYVWRREQAAARKRL